MQHPNHNNERSDLTPIPDSNNRDFQHDVEVTREQDVRCILDTTAERIGCHNPSGARRIVRTGWLHVMRGRKSSAEGTPK